LGFGVWGWGFRVWFARRRRRCLTPRRLARRYTLGYVFHNGVNALLVRDNLILPDTKRLILGLRVEG